MALMAKIIITGAPELVEFGLADIVIEETPAATQEARLSTQEVPASLQEALEIVIDNEEDFQVNLLINYIFVFKSCN